MCVQACPSHPLITVGSAALYISRLENILAISEKGQRIWKRESLLEEDCYVKEKFKFLINISYWIKLNSIFHAS